MMSLETCSGSNGVDWKTLAARHLGDQQLVTSDSPSNDDDDAQDREWRAALEHQRTCLSCRTAAIAAEPTVLFQRLPEIELSAAEIEAMRERVSGVRRGRTVAPGSPASEALKVRYRLQKWAGAAAVLAIAVTGSLGVSLSPGVAAGLTAADEAALEASLGALPLVEGVESYGTEQSVLVQGLMRSAAGDLDFAWVADGVLEP